MKAAYGACEAQVTIGKQIEVTYPAAFSAAPYFSATVYIQTGMHTGKMAYIQNQSIGMTSTTLDLQAWDGAAFQDVGDSETVTVSWMAIEK